MSLRTLALFIVLSPFAAFAQPAGGLPPFGSFTGGPFDTINNANLNVHFGIPIVSKAGRGLPFTYTLTYDNSIWAPVTTGGTTTWTPMSNGWGGSTQVETGYVTYQTTQNQCYYNGQYYYWNSFGSFSYHDSGGAPHALPSLTVYDWSFRGLPCGGGVSTGTASTNDGSGYTVTVQAYYGGAYASSAVTVAGTVITTTGPVGSGQIQDSNGNQLAFSTSSGTVTFTDTLGTSVLTIPSSGVLTYKNPSGGSSSYTPTYTSYGVWTSFGCPGVSEYSGMMTLISSLALPGTGSYSFTYEPSPGHSGYITGRIASVTLPTGGTISYQYSGGNNGINCSDGSTPTLTRTTNPGGTWTYARSGSTTTITDPASAHNQTMLTLQSGFEVQRKVYQGSTTSGTLLKTVDTCYNGTASPCTGTGVNLPITQVGAITSLPGTSTLKSQTVALYYSSGLPYEVDEYDYGVNAVGSLIRKTIIAYASLGNSIQNRPSSVTVKNPSNAIVAQTSYSYDQGSVTATSGTPQHASVSGSRGNATTVSRLVAGSTTLNQTFTYYDTGNVRTATGVNGAVTTYTYGSGASCGNSFVTSTALPLSLSTSATWDTPNCYGAVQKTATDANSRTTTTNYNDTDFWRPTSVVDPTNATTSITYATSPAFASESALNFNGSTSTADTRTTLDGLGRVHVSQRRQSQTSSNYDSVETDYDAVGRPSRVTVPYTATAGGTSSSAPATTTTYL